MSAESCGWCMEGKCEGAEKGQEAGLRNGYEGPPRAGPHERDPSLGDRVILSSRDGRLWGRSTAVAVLGVSGGPREQQSSWVHALVWLGKAGQEEADHPVQHEGTKGLGASSVKLRPSVS